MALRKHPAALRPQEITQRYLTLLDAHMSAFAAGTVDRAWGVKDFADRMFIHPKHLSNTLQEVTGQSPCDLYEERLMEVARRLLLAGDGPVAEVARQLTMDPSNFSKFFRRYEGITPLRYRELERMRRSA
jgi:AraC-like DNA-binding protein